MPIVLGIEYDGAQYHGWQSQTGLASVQQQVELALSQVAASPVKIYCAGRTDKAVHATQQVVHFESRVARRHDAWLLGANRYLPRDIRIIWVTACDDTFHARFSAISRQYCYLIYNDVVPSALFYSQMTWVYEALDVELMQQGAEYLLGEHDFSSFRAAQCQANHARRCVEFIQFQRYHHVIAMRIKANSFLHHMVRNIMGALLKVGKGEVSPCWIKKVLLAQDRTQAAATAPANGLYLTNIQYPEQFQLANNERLPLLYPMSYNMSVE